MLSLLLCAAGLGAIVLRATGFRAHGRAEYAALVMAAGMGLLAVALGALGLIGVLSWTRWLLPLGAALTVFSAIGAWRRAGGPWEWPGVPRWAPVAGAAAAILLLGGVPPVTDDDSLAYPMPIAQQLADEGVWRFWPHLARSVYPLSQMFLEAGLLVGGQDRLGLLSSVQFVLAALLIGLMARRLVAHPAAGPVAAIIALGCPAAVFLNGAAKEDLLVVMMTAAGALALGSRPDRSAAVVTGLFAGLAAGAKYTGLPIALALVVCVPFSCGRDQRVASLTRAALMAIVAGGLWYGVNLARFGNPVAPALPWLGSFPSSPEVVTEWLGGFGYGRSPLDFLLAPFRMALEVATWDAGLFGGRNNWINPVAWVGVPWALWHWRRRPEYRPLLVGAFVLYAVWFSGTQVARLLLPGLALLAVPAADAVLTLWTRVRAARLPIVLMLVVAAGLALTVSAVRFTRYATHPDGFLARETQHHDAVRWMNTHLDPAQHRVASWLRAPAGLHVPWMHLPPDYQVEIAPVELEDPARLHAALRRQRFTHVLGRPLEDGERPDWLVPLYVNETSLEGGTRFFRAAPIAPVAVFAVR